ncbi:iron-sulfur cluster insertion protein ErpA [Psychromonas sp. SP041]|uniref:iron-sulfur cluster insertion protein ErpA n=1 Tax=Psychromonas sp. SP041 TaxID=1365007 RepID=UPI0010C785A2|nr:iron-sulfur cluster insertion protein ErpA [Psychromonas sp. SP041]
MKEEENVSFDTSITITDNAVKELKNLLEDEADTTAVRVFVQGGGCSGFQYGFSFEENVSDEDLVIEREGVKICVDSLSYQYLDGASVDFEEQLMHRQFVINNPNATTSCGCGSSLS